MAWQLQEARSRLSEVVPKAMSEGREEVTLRSRRPLIVLAEECDRLGTPGTGFADALLSGPPGDDEFVQLINDRRPRKSRDIKL